jgi:hypothetical protein
MRGRRHGCRLLTIEHLPSPFVKLIIIINFISVIYNILCPSTAIKEARGVCRPEGRIGSGLRAGSIDERLLEAAFLIF